jgi:ABC-2 type transport system ATP-binding protein
VPDASPMVEVRDLVKRYGRTLAVDGVTLTVERGERFAVLGPNGAGKTTLIHVLTTLHRADSGTAAIAGIDVHRQPLRARRHLGVVFQEPSLDTRLTVMENLEFHGRIFGVPRRLRRRRIDELLTVVELGEWRDHLVRSLSRGMQRRLEIARALVHDASLLILDEPTVGLDAQTRGRMWSYLDELQRQRELTILVTTHYIEEVDSVDRVCIVDHGKVLIIGSPQELKRQHGAAAVRLVPSDEATLARLRSTFPEAVQDGDAWLVPISDEGAVEALLRELGSGLRAFQFELPTLETVFLSMTGRVIRDQAAGGRDRLLAFARQGGEHTR